MKSLQYTLSLTFICLIIFSINPQDGFSSEFLDQYCIQFVTANEDSQLLILATTVVDDQGIYLQHNGKITTLDHQTLGGISGSGFITTSGSVILTLEGSIIRSGTVTQTVYHFNFTPDDNNLLTGNYSQISQDNSVDNTHQLLSTGKAIITPCENLVDLSQLDLDEDGFFPPDDCDNSNPLVNPDAEDVPNDGIDNDCNPATFPIDVDFDSDGYTEQQGDCDDSNNRINPGAIDPIMNQFYSTLGIDMDCNPATYPVD